MHQLTLKELTLGLAEKRFSSKELTQHYIDRIKTHNPALNAVITLSEELALTQAENADTRIQQNNATALTGIPLLHKDIFCTQGVKTSCGSKMLDNFIAPYESTMTQQCQDAGMIMLGKTNMDEFAMGSSNENSFYGAVKNPWNTDCVPGGSSGGSASAVAARLAPIATGTDTGGSIRQPAALSGITGLKPTYGRVSRFGMTAFASSLDQAGPLTQTAEDAALMLNVMAGFDAKDSTCAREAVPDYTAELNQSIKGLTIGLPKQYFSKELDPAIADLITTAAKELEEQGATLKEIDLPHTNLAIPTYYIIAPAEASSNLSRFDGVRYGYRCEHPNNLDDLYFRSRGEGFGEEVKRRIMVGTYALSAGYYDAYYLKAQKVRRLIKNDFVEAFNEVDIILSPTSPNTAFKLGEKASDPIAMYLADIYTIAVNLAGLPGVSVPAGFIDGLPVGMQLIGNYFKESQLLNVAHQFQQASDWHKQVPVAFK
jgi:aspartyl-tRNA(Asn)/glutamyl-tRNA(Gln) amidotransferase subunit A